MAMELGDLVDGALVPLTTETAELVQEALDICMGLLGNDDARFLAFIGVLFAVGCDTAGLRAAEALDLLEYMARACEAEAEDDAQDGE